MAATKDSFLTPMLGAVRSKAKESNNAEKIDPNFSSTTDTATSASIVKTGTFTATNSAVVTTTTSAAVSGAAVINSTLTSITPSSSASLNFDMKAIFELNKIREEIEKLGNFSKTPFKFTTEKPLGQIFYREPNIATELEELTKKDAVEHCHWYTFLNRCKTYDGDFKFFWIYHYAFRIAQDKSTQKPIITIYGFNDSTRKWEIYPRLLYLYDTSLVGPYHYTPTELLTQELGLRADIAPPPIEEEIDYFELNCFDSSKVFYGQYLDPKSAPVGYKIPGQVSGTEPEIHPDFHKTYPALYQIYLKLKKEKDDRVKASTSSFSPPPSSNTKPDIVIIKKGIASTGYNEKDPYPFNKPPFF